MKKDGIIRVIVMCLFLPVIIFTIWKYPNNINYPILIILAAIFGIQQKEKVLLSKLISKQTENYNSILRHEIKTPILAQIRALELLLKGTFGKLNNEQKEMIELTLTSCKHSYKVIRGQLYP